MYNAVFIDSFSLCHHSMDNKKRDRKLEMDDLIGTHSYSHRHLGMLYCLSCGIIVLLTKRNKILRFSFIIKQTRNRVFFTRIICFQSDDNYSDSHSIPHRLRGMPEPACWQGISPLPFAAHNIDSECQAFHNWARSADVDCGNEE